MQNNRQKNDDDENLDSGGDPSTDISTLNHVSNSTRSNLAYKWSNVMSPVFVIDS